MPIKPENKKLYPKNWKEISKRIRFERAKGLCEKCGANYGDKTLRQKSKEYLASSLAATITL